ncbi:MAG TPA: aminotransferase class V-fold PLP-dependent enzyme [bacterium]
MEEIRELFPITKDLVYFDHASTGPMTAPARKAIEECIDVYTRRAQFDFSAYFSKLARCRLTVARLIGAEPEEIAFVTNTSEGVYIALINIPLRPDDKVLVMDEVFPTVRYVTDYNIPQAQKIYVPMCGRDPVDALHPHVDNNVKAVVIDLVQFATGEMVDLPRLSAFLDENDISLVVDGMQAIGSLNMKVSDANIDFLACGASKWLFCPNGIGFLYVNQKKFGTLNKLHTGWLGASWKSFEDFAVNPPLFEDARMFEQGTRNVIGISALSANCKLLHDQGLVNVENRIQQVKTALRKGLGNMGYDILTPASGRQSGIITARPDRMKHHDVRQLYDSLKDNKIVVSLRNQAIRFSPHFYNTTEEVNIILDILKK